MRNVLWNRRWCCRRRPEDGFTLIELAVVMLIIAILVVVSLAYFGSINVSQVSTSMQNLKGAQMAAQTVWAQNSGSFNGITAAQLDAAEPGISFQVNGVGSTDGGTVPSNPDSASVAFWPGGNTAMIETYTNLNNPTYGGACLAALIIANTSSSLYSLFGATGVWWGAYPPIGSTGVGWPGTVAGSINYHSCNAWDFHYQVTNSDRWSQNPTFIYQNVPQF